MAGLALPVVGTLAVEVVHQVDTASTILTRVVFALVDIWRRTHDLIFTKTIFIFCTKKWRTG